MAPSEASRRIGLRRRSRRSEAVDPARATTTGAHCRGSRGIHDRIRTAGEPAASTTGSRTCRGARGIHDRIPHLPGARGIHDRIPHEADGACRRGRCHAAGSVTHSPESPLFERRTGLGGPTARRRGTARDATRPVSHESGRG